MTQEHMTKRELADEYRVLHRRLSNHNKIFIDNILPRIERIERNLKDLSAEARGRLMDLELDLQALAGEGRPPHLRHLPDGVFRPKDQNDVRPN